MSYRLISGVCVSSLLCVVAFGEQTGAVFDHGGDASVNAKAAQKQDVVREGDKLKTGAAEGSFMQVNFDNDTIKLGPNSDLTVDTRRQETKLVGLFRKKPKLVNRSVLTLNSGSALINVKGFKKTRSSFEVRTPTAVAGVRGTYFMVVVFPATLTSPPRTQVYVFEGKVQFSVPKIAKQTTIKAGKDAENTGDTGDPSDATDTTPEERKELEEKTGVTEGEITETDRTDGTGTGVTVLEVQEVIAEEIPKATIEEVRIEANVTGDGKPVSSAGDILPEPPGQPSNP